MASLTSLKSQFLINNPLKQSTAAGNSIVGNTFLPVRHPGINRQRRILTVTAAVGDLSSGSTTYLIAGAVTVALLGTAFPIIFSRKDTCPECDGAGFVRKGGVTLKANAARKDQGQIVCQNCNGLGKLNQVDK